MRVRTDGLLKVLAMSAARIGSLVGLYFLLSAMTGCSPERVKPGAFDDTALRDRLPAADLLRSITASEQTLTPGPAWLAGLDSQQELTFLGVSGVDDHSFGVLLDIDSETERLRYLPLATGATPLSILSDPGRRAALKKLLMSWSQEGRGPDAALQIKEISFDEMATRLSAPIAQPKQIYAVAANYPSHLFSDLSLPEKTELIARLQQARPRIFRKYPPVPAPGEAGKSAGAWITLPGPLDTISAPEQVKIPSLSGQNRSVPGHLDYEVEIAVLIGRDLTWDDVQKMSDADLRRAVAGYLLFSDSKVRDPQAMGKILRAFQDEKVAEDNPYRVGDSALDGTLGIWDELTCHLWSYAASWGRYAAHGPFLVAAADPKKLSPRMNHPFPAQSNRKCSGF